MTPLLLNMGGAEMLIIGVVALVVVGPKDLPVMFKKVGQFVGKARGMARDFQNAMNDAADGTGINELKSTFDEATNLKNMGLDDIPSAMKDYGDKVTTGKPATKTKEASAKKPVKAKPAAKKATQSKTPAKKPSPKKPAAKKAPAKKAAAKKPSAKKA